MFRRRTAAAMVPDVIAGIAIGNTSAAGDPRPPSSLKQQWQDSEWPSSPIPLRARTTGTGAPWPTSFAPTAETSPWKPPSLAPHTPMSTAAYPATRYPGIAAAEQEARDAQRGLWGPPCYGHTESIPR
jgi:hypothetical protein